LLGSKRRDHGCYIKWPEDGMQKLHSHLYLGHLSDASLQNDLQLFIHTFTHIRQQSQPCKATDSSSRAVRLGCSFVSCSGTPRQSARRSRRLNWQPNNIKGIYGSPAETPARARSGGRPPHRWRCGRSQSPGAGWLGSRSLNSTQHTGVKRGALSKWPISNPTEYCVCWRRFF
jgi:hypothetical protein